MSDTAEKIDEQPAEQPEPAPDRGKKGPRLQTFRFIAVFILLVMFFLTGYRYAMDTVPNMWYLYKVASHTAFVLDKVGHSGEVEPWNRNQNSSRIRAELAAWANDEEIDPQEIVYDADAEPLSTWEIWKYKAFQRLRTGGTLFEHGPTIRFIKFQGLSDERLELTREKGEVSRSKTLTDEERSDELTGIELMLAEIMEIEEGLPEGDERAEVMNNIEFSFRVVPDCGAIPSMSIFVAAVIAFPAMWRKRLLGVVAGLVALYAINVARLSTLAYIGAIDRTPDSRWFNFIHEYVWQGIFLVFVVAIWMIWIEFVVRPRKDSDNGSAA